jgi:heme/copper-type cytochrome/quinol oxidase subunit 3
MSGAVGTGLSEQHTARAPMPVPSSADAALWRADPHKVLMGFFISSESFFFVSLIVTYITFHGSTGPQAKDVLDVPLTGLFSIALFASSGTLYLAERGLHRRNGAQLRLWLLVTIALGAIFIAGQAYEYHHLIDEGVTISSGLFGTTFFTLTGFHGLHVIIGLIALGIIAVLTFKGDFDRGNEMPLTTAGLYWHFVDAVWVVVFSVVYLWTLVS